MREADLLCHAGRQDDVVAVGPHDGERVVGHAATPSETRPADGLGRDELEDRIKGGVGRGRAGYGNAEGQALVDGEAGPCEASVGVLDGDRVGLGEGCGLLDIV